jgi:ABC-2 type transport system permease protein
MIQRTKSRYRYSVILLKQLVKSDFKLRYQNSFLGYLWSLLKPLFLFVIMYMVFVKVLEVDFGVSNSGAYLLFGLVLWSFFTELTGGSVGAIVGKGDLLRKLNFPKYVIVLATSCSALVNFFLNLIVVAVFVAITGIDLSWSALLAPVVFFELFVLSLGLGFFLSATYVKLRDIGYIWDVVMQALFYGTPIFFPITLAPLWAQKLIMLSPLAQTMQDMRYLLISDKTTTIGTVYGNEWIRVVPVGITFLIALIAALYFRKQSRFFAEEI